MKIDPTVKKETIYVCVVTLILSMLMESVFLILRQWHLTVLFGNLVGAGTGILNFFKKIVSTVVGIFKMFAAEISDIAETFKNGDWKTRTSFFVMGFGNIARGQVLRGILFLAFEIIFIVYMVCGGAH